jgi:hypothetical protein
MLEDKNRDAEYHRLTQRVSIINLVDFLLIIIKIFSFLGVPLAHRHHREFGTNNRVTHHQQKDFMVLDSHASADPRTMMIHPHNASAT